MEGWRVVEAGWGATCRLGEARGGVATSSWWPSSSRHSLHGQKSFSLGLEDGLFVFVHGRDGSWRRKDSGQSLRPNGRQEVAESRREAEGGFNVGLLVNLVGLGRWPALGSEVLDAVIVTVLVVQRYDGRSLLRVHGLSLGPVQLGRIQLCRCGRWVLFEIHHLWKGLISLKIKTIIKQNGKILSFA